MIEIVRSYINDGIGLVQMAGLLVVGFVVLATWSKSKSTTATISVMIVGMLVLGFLHNAEWLAQTTADDIKSRDNGMGAVGAGAGVPGGVDGGFHGVRVVVGQEDRAAHEGGLG